MTKNRVVNRGADDTRRGGSFQSLRIFLFVQANDRETLADIADEEESLVAARAAGSDSHEGKGAVEFG